MQFGLQQKMVSKIVPSLLVVFFLIIGGFTKNSFVVDYENDRFLKDGKPFQYISGTLHYFQIPHDLWRDRMERSRALGINAIQTYVMWSKHEPKKGQYNFKLESNLTEYLEIAKNLSLSVILRIGPYIDAEQDFGGLPYWLLKYPNISLRAFEKQYINEVAVWFSVLLPKIRPMLYSNGGPIIMVQIENEYGSYGCDKNYTMYLQAIVMKYLQDQVVFFTTDGYGLTNIECGQLADTLTTIDFGVLNESSVTAAFNNLRRYMPNGPKVNSEFYVGWYDAWGQSNKSVRATSLVTDTMRYMWRQNASFNIYPIHGGSNWGYQGGSENPPFHSVTTEYDFDAPISEAGDITKKFLDMRSTIEELTMQKVPFAIPKNTTKYNYGKVLVQYLGNVFDLLFSLTNLKSTHRSMYPMTMEDLDLAYGFALYESRVTRGGRFITIGEVSDRAYIMVDHQLIKVIQRGSNKTKLRLANELKEGSLIHILVENQGRVAYGKYLADRKGLLSNVSLDNDVITNWTMYSLTLENLYGAEYQISLKSYFKKHQNRVKSTANRYLPSFYLGYLMLDTVGDTFFNSSGWGKGQLIINGINIGRYWPQAGPQMTLYVPSSFLSGFNQVILFELDQPGNCDDKFICYVDFVDHPIYKT